MLAACSAPAGDSRLPPSPAGLGLPPGSEPVVASISNARAALADPARRIGANPAYAARTIGQLEYVAAMMGEPKLAAIAPVVEPLFRAGTAEARRSLGIREEAEGRAVIAALAAAAAAFDRGDQAAAEASLAPVSPDPALTRARLATLPALPRANSALALADLLGARMYAFDDD